MKRQIPLLITFITGIIMIIAFFIPKGFFSHIESVFFDWAMIIGGFTLVLGLFSLLLRNVMKIKRKSYDWYYSVVLIIGLFATLIIGVITGISAGSPTQYIFVYFLTPLGASMFSLLAFFIASAAYRAFRAKSAQATLLLIAAVIVMLGQVPLGTLIWSKFPNLAAWVMSYPNMSAQRGILLGAALGGISMSLRILFGLERSYLGGGD